MMCTCPIRLILDACGTLGDLGCRYQPRQSLFIPSTPRNYTTSLSTTPAMAGALLIAELHPQVSSGRSNDSNQIPDGKTKDTENLERFLDLLYALPEEKVLNPKRSHVASSLNLCVDSSTTFPIHIP